MERIPTIKLNQVFDFEFSGFIEYRYLLFEWAGRDEQTIGIDCPLDFSIVDIFITLCLPAVDPHID